MYKVIYFIAHPHSIGGAERVLLKQAYIMQARGHQVKIVLQTDSMNMQIPERVKLCEELGLDYISMYYSIATCMEEIDILSCLYSFDDVLGIIREYAPDLIHSVQLNIAVEMAARELGIPHLMNIYPISQGMFNLKWLDVYPKFHSADSLMYSKAWAEGLRIESRCVRVAYQNRNGECTIERSEKKRVIELINIAIFAEYKRQYEILQFVEVCCRKGFEVHITFLGNDRGDYGDKCKRFVSEHNLDENVTFQGLVFDVERYLVKADLLIHASICESYPGVIVEAMANNVPVLVTPVAGVPELVKNEENGFLTKGYHVQDIYEAFMRYLEYKEKGNLKEIKKNGYRTYLHNHTYESIGDALERYYTDIMRNVKKQRFSQNKEVGDTLAELRNSEKWKKLGEYSLKRIWFLYHISKVITRENYQNAIIWGAGNFGKIALEWCDYLGLRVEGYIDSYKQGSYMAYPIYKRDDEIVDRVDVIIVAIADSKSCLEIMKFLGCKNRVRNKNFYLMCNDPCLNIYD